MVARTVAVKLTAEASSYMATIGKATLATQQFASKGQAAVAKHSDSINKLANTAGLLGAGMLAGVAFVVRSAAQFDKAMSAVAATGNDARLNMEGLRKAAIDMGASTAFSATEAAKGIENMLKAGVSARDVMGGGLKGALDLAAAGNLEVGDAAEIAATAMAQFNLTGSQVPHIADLLAAGAGKAQGEVADMGMALKQSGLVASQFGLSLEDTTGTLSAFANAGLIGSDSGTSFKTMLLSLASPSEKAKGLMEDLGIAAYNTEGQFVGVTDLAGQLQEKLGGLTQAERDAALAVIFGTDAIRAANVLYKEGAVGIQGWIDQTNDAGYAAKVARERLNNLSGDVEQLQGAFESAFIEGGSGPNEALRGLTQSATAAVRAFGNLPAPVLETGVKLAAISGIGLLAVAGIGKLATSAVELGSAFTALSSRAPKAARGMATVGKAAGIATAAVIGLQLAVGSSEKFKFTANVDEAADALLRLGSTNVDLNAMFTMDEGVIDGIHGFGDALDRVANPRIYDRIGSFLDGVAGTTASATNQMRANFAAVDKAISSLGPEEAGRAFGEMRKQAEAAGVPIEELVNLFPAYRDQVRDTATATGHTVRSTAELADLMENGLPPAATASATALAKTANKAGGVGDEAKEARKQLDDMVESMFAAANAAIELEGSEDGVEAAIDDATKSMKENGKTLDNNTEKGRNNRAALRNLATASIAYREKLIQQGASTKKVNEATDDAREAFIKVGRRMGLTEKDAKELADKFGLLKTKIDKVPKNPSVKLAAKFSASATKAAVEMLKFVPGSQASGFASALAGRAQGGPIHGDSPTDTADNIPIMATAGEYMQPVSAVKHYGADAMDAIRQKRIPREALQGYATGGQILKAPGQYGSVSRGANSKAAKLAWQRGYDLAWNEFQTGSVTGPSGSVGAYSASMAGTMAAMRKAGARRFTTYPGHHPSQAKARDVTPHSWKIANTARASRSVWYVIYQMRIASKNHGNGWRQYHPTNRRGDWQHRRHVHVAWYGGGTGNARRGPAVVGENGPELVNMRGGEQVRPVTDYRFAGGPGGAGGGGVVVINQHFHFDRYLGNRNELVQELVTLKKQGRMDVVLK